MEDKSMRKVTDIFPFQVLTDQDERARKYLLPVKLKLIRGEVLHSELLLADRPCQALLGKSDVCILRNSAGNEKALVLVDFGRELHGNLRLTIAYIQNPSMRANVTIRLGESVMEALSPIGHKNATNDHAVRDNTISLGPWGTFETNESGFRFAAIQLEDEGAMLAISAIHACFIYRDIPYVGFFACSDPLLEQIWETAAYTVHLNMQNYLWDGIKRDRLVWMGDMHTEVLTIQSVFGANGVVPKSLDFIRDATPPGSWMNDISSYSLWWILMHADWYQYTGDMDYLKEQRAYLRELADILISLVDEDGAELLPQRRFLDWPNDASSEAKHAGLQGMLKLALDASASLFKALGEDERSARCLATSRRMHGHVPDCAGSKQAASFLSLSGLADPKRINDETLSSGGARGYSTFLGFYTLAAKALAGDYQGAIDDLRAYWGGMLQMGATTFWEDFDLDWMENAVGIDQLVPEGKVDIHGDHGAYCYVNYRHSLCHGWASGPVPFVTRFILGIDILEPGCKKLSIKPHLGDLQYARGAFPTPMGIVRVWHDKNPDGTVTTQYQAPKEIEIVI